MNGPDALAAPIQGGGDLADQVKIYAIDGERPIFGDPKFRNPRREDFRLSKDVLAAVAGIEIGAYAPGTDVLWWKRSFPPHLDIP